LVSRKKSSKKFSGKIKNKPGELLESSEIKVLEAGVGAGLSNNQSAVVSPKTIKTEESMYSGEKGIRFDFVGKNRYWLIFTLIIIAVGIVFFFTRGFNFGIDFLGGNLMEVKFEKSITIDELRKEMGDIGYGTAILQSTGSDQFIIRTTPLTSENKQLIIDSLDKKFGIVEPLIQDRNVAPGFSQTITRNALIAVAISIIGVLIYVWVRFTVRFALAAILEIIHDVLLILSVYAITYREFNTTTIAVILTILGYSLSDAIVIFDRIREELRINKRDGFPAIINYSINKVLSRSLATMGTTLFPIIILLIIGNETLKDFAFGLFVGIISGAYSSIFVGSPVLIAWNKRFPKYKK
jgi:preprotein translocase SecF subunit